MTATSAQYLLLFRGTDLHRGLSPEQMQQYMEQWNAWYERLSAQGKVTAGQPLAAESKIVAGKHGERVTDGPFAEAKESIAGYFLLEVSGLAEATEIAKECPALAHGGMVEVRPVGGHAA